MKRLCLDWWAVPRWSPLQCWLPPPADLGRLWGWCGYRCTKIWQQAFGIGCFTKSMVSRLRKVIIPFHLALIRDTASSLNTKKTILINWMVFRWGQSKQGGLRTCPLGLKTCSMRRVWERLCQRNTRVCCGESQVREWFDHRACAVSILHFQGLTGWSSEQPGLISQLTRFEQRAGLETSWGAAQPDYSASLHCSFPSVGLGS